MALSKQRGSLFDPLRKRWTEATPEEFVRQKLLTFMTKTLGFPKDLLSVERQLSELPHLSSEVNLPTRRADVICFAKGIHPYHSLFPLLLIECKRDPSIKEDAIRQAVGYNHYVQAPFVAIAGEGIVELVYPDRVAFLPRFVELVERACKM